MDDRNRELIKSDKKINNCAKLIKKYEFRVHKEEMYPVDGVEWAPVINTHLKHDKYCLLNYKETDTLIHC